MNGYYSPDSGCNTPDSVAVKYSFKIMLIGDSCVGKTCLLIRFKDNMFMHNNFIATVGMDYRNKLIDVDGSTVKLQNISKFQIWDTAGQERFRSLTHTYYRDADAILLIFDLSARSTFESTRSWLTDIDKFGRDDVMIILVGNKSDLSNTRRVNESEVLKVAEEHGITYIETSGKTGANVETLFRTVAEKLLKRRTGVVDQIPSPHIDINCNKTSPEGKKASMCCT